MLLPATKLGYSPSVGSTYSLAVSSPFLKHASMMPLSLLSTSSLVQATREEFWAISRPETATPPALAALPEGWKENGLVVVMMMMRIWMGGGKGGRGQREGRGKGM